MTKRQATPRRGAVVFLALMLAGPALAAQPQERQTPSGMPVPRYVSLKFDKVNARAGPGDDHKLLFVYRVKGLPLQVIAETSEWRRVCDPEGTLAWVHKRVTDGRRTTINMSAQPVAMLLVMAQPWPKSTSLAAAGATPSPSLAKAGTTKARPVRKAKVFLTLSMVLPAAGDRGKAL